MNVGEWVAKRAFNHPERPFLQDEDGRFFNNRVFNERVNRTAQALAALDIVKGERIAVLLQNCSEFIEIFFACGKTGAIMVPVNYRLAVPELAYILRDSSPRALIYAADFTDKAQALKAAGLPIASWFRLDGSEPAADPALSDFTASFPSHEPMPVSEVTNDDPLFIMYTSGTTGDPKGAVVSNGNILYGAIHALVGCGVNAAYKSLVVAPLFHIGALVDSVTPILYAGGSLYLQSFYNASEIITVIQREKINYMFAVPVMFQMMTRSAEWNQADFSHVYHFNSGGAPIPVPVIRKFQEKGVGFAQCYGMTEAGRLTVLDLEDSIRKAGSVGMEVFHLRLRIVDEQDRDVAPGDVGEIIVKGPNVFARYWGKPAETAEAIRDGWFHTNDMGRRDEEGFLYLVGRKQDMIISAGENVYPAEVERAIQALPEVKETAVVAMPDEIRGEVVAAFVMLHEGRPLSAGRIIRTLKGRIAPFKIPKKIIFCNDLPRNSTGKVLKRELRKQLWPEEK